MKNKGLTVAAIVLAVLAAVSAVIFFTFGKGSGDGGNAETQAPAVYSYEQSEYTAASQLKMLDKIYLPTGLSGVYYSADLSGKFEFYTYANGVFAPFTGEVGSVDTSVSVSRQRIPATISYIEQGGRVCGFGLFTTDISSADAPVYPYAFFKLISKPVGYGSGYLLMVDFEKENFYRTDKIYSDLFSFDLSSGTATQTVNQSTRMIDYNGAYRNDWAMLTDGFIANMGSEGYFLSSRNYNNKDRGLVCDIMVMSKAYKPVIKTNGITGLWASVQADGLHYLRNTATGFNSVVLTDGEAVKASFEGNYFSDYLASGDYIINKMSLTLTNLLTGESKTLDKLKNAGIENAVSFSVSPDGTAAVFAFAGEPNTNGVEIQRLAYYKDGSEPVYFGEPLLFSETALSFVWLSNSQVMSARPANGTGSPVVSAVWSFDTAN